MVEEIEKEINIVYIDDKPSTNITEYLNEEYKFRDAIIKFAEITFTTDQDYTELIQDNRVKCANVIIIDSMLFENNNVESKKFSGEEFKIILKKYFPFIETIVITQNKNNDRIEKVDKYNSEKYSDFADYICKSLNPALDASINKVISTRIIFDKLNNSSTIEKSLIEQIKNNLDGIETYDALNREDIDNIINLFKGIQNNV